MRDQAELVIIGAGIVGASAAYHLQKLGWGDIVVVDQGPLFDTGGSTSHAPGLVFQTNSSKMMCEFAQYTVELLNGLSYEGKSCFYPVGGVEIAHSEARWAELKRRHGWATSYGLDASIITPGEVKELIPIVDENVIYGGYHVPSDGDARAVAAVAAMAEACGSAVEFVGGTTVTDIVVQDGRVRAVETDRGRIATGKVLLATNIWGPVLASKVGVILPLFATEHQYIITTPLDELAGETRDIVHPILRHQDASMYFRQHRDAYGIGSYQHEPHLVDPFELGKTAMNPFTPEDFAGAWASATELLPPLRGHDFVTKFNGMFAFTVDGMPIMGPVPHAEGLWTAIGVWVTHAGGVGREIANWMNDGAPAVDVHEADISRFQEYVASWAYTHARCAQQYREVYDILHPLQQMEYPRDLRLSVFHDRLKAHGGVFFESAGWERPQWFAENAALLDRYAGKIPQRSGWEAQFWSPIEGAEHLAVRENVGLFDLSAFTKLEIGGPGALGYLQYLTSNDIDRGLGKVVYTSLLDQNGGIICDLTITRLGEDHFLVLTGGGSGPHDLAWFRAHAPGDGSVHITDATRGYCALGLWGPGARAVLSEVAEGDVSDAAFPYFTARPLTINMIPALALRISYAGELGWEIYAAPEYGPRLWDTLWEAGEPRGIVAAGGGAFNSLRLEKGYRLWGADIDPDHTPYEAGLGWAVKPDHGLFLGRDALLQRHDAGIDRRLCCMTLDEPGAVALGKEPIVDGGKTLGYVTSADYGYSVGKFIAYGYLPADYAEPGTKVEVVYFGEHIPATVSEEPLYDPAMEKIKA